MSNDTPTPRTLAALNLHWNGGAWSREFSDFARKLERELAASQERERALREALERATRFFDGGLDAAGFDPTNRTEREEYAKISAELNAMRAALAATKEKL